MTQASKCVAPLLFGSFLVKKSAFLLAKDMKFILIPMNIED
jgi:hypothetical protein